MSGEPIGLVADALDEAKKQEVCMRRTPKIVVFVASREIVNLSLEPSRCVHLDTGTAMQVLLLLLRFDGSTLTPLLCFRGEGASLCAGASVKLSSGSTKRSSPNAQSLTRVSGPELSQTLNPTYSRVHRGSDTGS